MCLYVEALICIYEYKIFYNYVCVRAIFYNLNYTRSLANRVITNKFLKIYH